MAIRQYTLPKQKDSKTNLFQIKSWKGDTLTLQFEGLKENTSYVFTFSCKLGYITSDLTSVSNALPAFADSGNLTQNITTNANGVGTITISASQTAALTLKSTYVLEIEANGDGTIETYGQYQLYIEQELVNTAPPGPQYNYMGIQTLSPAGSTSALNYNSGFIFQKNISSQQTIAISNPKQAQMLLLITTNTAANIDPPILPASTQLFADNWDSSDGAANLISFLCIDQTTPKYIATYNTKLN